MSFTPAFTTSQNYGDIDAAIFTDTSTGSDAAITGRIIYITKYNGDYIVPTNNPSTSAILWPAGSNTATIQNLLDKDYCVNITVKWLGGSTILYSKVVLTLFTAYSELVLRQLTQAEVANRNLLNSANFWEDKIKLRTLVDDATQAVTSLNDQTIAQLCMDEAKRITDNISTFF